MKGRFPQIHQSNNEKKNALSLVVTKENNTPTSEDQEDVHIIRSKLLH